MPETFRFRHFSTNLKLFEKFLQPFENFYDNNEKDRFQRVQGKESERR